MQATKVINKNKIRKREMYSAEFARVVGALLPQGSKKNIAVSLKLGFDYVRSVLSGNRNYPLKSPSQIAIMDMAIDILNAEYERRTLDWAAFSEAIKPLNTINLQPKMRATA